MIHTLHERTILAGMARIVVLCIKWQYDCSCFRIDYEILSIILHAAGKHIQLVLDDIILKSGVYI